MGRLTELLGQLREQLNNLSATARRLLTGAVVALVVAVVLYLLLVVNVRYSVLFSNLEVSHAARIVEEIEAIGNVKYKLEDGGSTILVDEKELTGLRLKLAMAGNLLDNTTGYELFDNQGLMVTDEDRKIMYQRATQGELERTIRSLEEVRFARVHLSLAEDSIYTVTPRDASATVVLELMPNTELTLAQVEGIVNLVAGAVASLPKENVQVLDTGANLLSAALGSPGGVGGQGVLDERQRIIDSYESRIAGNLMGLLEQAFGRDKVAVSVLADIDFDSEEQLQVIYEQDPENFAIGEREEYYGGDGLGDRLSAGPVDNNIQNVILQDEAGNLQTYDAYTRYEVNRTEISTVKAVGILERLSISVLYDGNLNADMRGRMENIVMASAGVDLTRGDMVNIDGISFDRSYEEELARQLEEQRLAEESAVKLFGVDRNLIYSVAGAVLFLIALLVFLARRASRRKELLQEEMEAQALAEGERKKLRKVDRTSGEGILVGDDDDGGDDEYVIPDLEKPLDDAGKQEKALKKYAADHPDEMAELLKSWIKE